MTSNTIETDQNSIPHSAQHPHLSMEDGSPQAPSDSVTMASYSALPAPPSRTANTKAAQPWLSPSTIRVTLHLVSGLLFAALLVPYTQYSRAKKANEHDTCNTNAQHLYESTLARCDANAARNFSLRGGVFGLSWMEIIAVLGAAFAWQYLVSFLQDWAVVNVSSIKDRIKQRK
ncbi:hypothetical protein A1O1_02445 [Capronia coronata CBS 617.96]|uniref:Uncharacterized protein n=1 Tax=Capronia coronata CBS 617.96 TaxID=1182541 RepID=W9YMA4_9EURO|nr:uncharacterized protein A1O1_02445 [Capronia coronata CBS 617.96]EXJ94052.1 hypothetical protein A1O1_02445 [Capronia coronata CBS 617.96]